MTEKRFTSQQKCGHCGNVAPMEVATAYSQTHTQYDKKGDPWECAKIFELLVCPACHRVILRTYWWSEDMESEGDTSPEILYPGETRLPPGLPSAVESAFLSAQKVKAIDANAFGVMVGRVIDEVCADKKASGESLVDKLKDLASRKEIPEKLVGVAHGLRKLRNVGAHADLGGITDKEVPIVEDLCRAVLDYVYGAPYLTQRAIDQLAALKPKQDADSK
jgi:Domain of unknown function (DUF4145)